MQLRRRAWGAIIVVALGAAFWAGSAIQKASYLDRCLDRGGGQNPGNHPICVIEEASAPLQLGPILIMAQDVIRAEIRDGAGDQVQIELALTEGVAAALGGFTEASVGDRLDIRIDGNLVRSVNIAEGVQGERFLLVLPRSAAESLSRRLGVKDL